MSTTQNHLSNCCAVTDEELLRGVRQLAANYKGKEGSLIQVLHMVQGVCGFLPLNVQQIVAEELELPLSTVSGVVSFYSFFATKPRGKHTIRVCMGTACYVRGGVSIVEELEKLLHIQAGGTTEDGVFTFEIARCIGSCGLARYVIDDTVYRK
jgi:NADH:ubiquinone oxidoreductase subunit E